MHAALVRDGQWRIAFDELRQSSRRRRRSLARAIGSRVIRPFVADTIAAMAGSRRAGMPIADARISLLRPGIARAARDLVTRPLLARSGAEHRVRVLSDGHLPARATAWALLGARHGVAFTHPLMDRSVIDFVLSLPIERLVRGGWTRQPFRDAMRGVLPDAIAARESKFSPFPEDAILYADAKPRLLAAAERLRGNAAVGAFVDLDMLIARLRALPVGAAARALAEGTNRGRRPPVGSIAAVRALAIARHVASFE
jgi:asparagine synthase (glutamine-hydrolysing)